MAQLGEERIPRRRKIRRGHKILKFFCSLTHCNKGDFLVDYDGLEKHEILSLCENLIIVHDVSIRKRFNGESCFFSFDSESFP